MASFRYRGRRSRPSSRGASPNRSTSSQSCPVPSNPAPVTTVKVSSSALPSPSWCLILHHHHHHHHWFLFCWCFSVNLIGIISFLVDLFPLICESMSLFLFCWFTIVPQTPQHITRNYDKPWLTNSKPSTPLKSSDSFGSQGSSSEVESCTAHGLECFTIATQLKFNTPAASGLFWLLWLNLCWEHFTVKGLEDIWLSKKGFMTLKFQLGPEKLMAFISVPNLYSNVSQSL